MFCLWVNYLQREDEEIVTAIQVRLFELFFELLELNNPSTLEQVIITRENTTWGKKELEFQEKLHFLFYFILDGVNFEFYCQCLYSMIAKSHFWGENPLVSYSIRNLSIAFLFYYMVGSVQERTLNEGTFDSEGAVPASITLYMENKPSMVEVSNQLLLTALPAIPFDDRDSFICTIFALANEDFKQNFAFKWHSSGADILKIVLNPTSDDLFTPAHLLLLSLTEALTSYPNQINSQVSCLILMLF